MASKPPFPAYIRSVDAEENDSPEKPLSRRWRLLLKALIVMILLGAFGWFVLPWFFPIPESLTQSPVASPVLLDRHGAPIRYLTSSDFSRSAPAQLSEIPARLIDSTLAAEDKRFYQHHGIDVFATARSAWDFLRYRRAVSGASTVTQQLAKLSRPPSERNLTAKFFEAMLARRLEMTWDKDRILEAYFARLEYGNLRTGPVEAARFYFQKPLGDLSLGECSLLAGLPQAPSRLNPVRHPERALKRRAFVLDRLAVTGKYKEAAIELARAEPITLRPLRETASAPWLSRVDQDAARMRSTLDLSLQQDIEQIVREETAKLKSANLRHAAVVVIDNATGDILAMVSSADWNDSRGGQIHGALTPRSPGSTLKPFTYALGFRHLGHLPSTVIADVPLRLRTEQGLQLPENYDRTYRGPVTIRTALACSLNIPALREMESLGGEEKLRDFLGELGISTLTEDPGHYGLGLTLGNAPVKLLELTNAYACLSRMGGFLPTRLFMDEQTPVEKPLLDPTNAWLIADILSDKDARAPAFSSGGPLDLPFRCAVKTGTSSDFRDNWCIGFTPEFTVGVWGGNFENRPMENISGVSGAGPIFHRSLVRAHRGKPASWYLEPEGMKNISIDPCTGRDLRSIAPISNTSLILERVISEKVPISRPIPLARPTDYDEKGRALLDATYREWYGSKHNRRRNELALDEDSINAVSLEIERPRDGSTILLDPEMPGSGGLKLLSNLPEFTTWSCDSLEISGDTASLTPGTHVITATDTRDGSEHTVSIEVKSL
ncbi:MAG: penicillin-binding protein 1C [Akkermansiaceae bacterium]|nr:penicillin-binding protein 1C [Akkermansiaceae bacterium]MDP4647364.1 penicillin-binding protein 1C [Akkermansiaceae bacterium]MDP4720954.1 penicillin-binding protein 1C [Akkermansiaceae bacterium]MDP4779516.1 penicillin-binding protein 1C [Akkermansiaceae bacterium]MDP4898931.1 penicillin-binding protein 1C [Akkermansiaceae bacterium]